MQVGKFASSLARMNLRNRTIKDPHVARNIAPASAAAAPLSCSRRRRNNNSFLMAEALMEKEGRKEGSKACGCLSTISWKSSRSSRLYNDALRSDFIIRYKQAAGKCTFLTTRPMRLPKRRVLQRDRSRHMFMNALKANLTAGSCPSV